MPRLTLLRYDDTDCYLLREALASLPRRLHVTITFSFHTLPAVYRDECHYIGHDIAC